MLTEEQIQHREKVTITIMGVALPRYQDCPWCGAKQACEFDRVAYRTPCEECRETERFQQKDAESAKMKGTVSMDDALKSTQVASVWEGNGRTYYVNNKGNVIKDEPSKKPLPLGKKDWK